LRTSVANDIKIESMKIPCVKESEFLELNLKNHAC